MANRPKFDVLRGWPKGGAVEGIFVPASVALYEGDLVEILSTGKVEKAVLAASDDKLVWCVIEGNAEDDSYSGHYLNKVVAITGDYEVITTKFVAGAYAPGLAVSVAGDAVPADAGKFILDAALPTVGFVKAYDAVAGTLTVVMAK